MRFSSLVLAISFIVISGATATAKPAQFVIVNFNDPNVGLNDPTPVAPVGGNTGTTLGEQRLIALQYAASLWSAMLDSKVPIRIQARFVPLANNMLGSTGTLTVNVNFPKAPLPDTWYPGALANKLAGVDLDPGFDDIRAIFSTNFDFYLGLDNNHGPLIDLVTVVLHEFAHGLGFSHFVNLTNGKLFLDLPDAYSSKLFDTTIGLHWPLMTNAQRVASATNYGRVVWDGAFVTAGVPNVLSLGSPEVRAISPPAVAGIYQFGTADFGPPIGSPNVTADVVAAIDAADVAGSATTDGCSPLTNAGAVAGKIALIERGACGFAVKARNATNAGAAGVIIYNNVANVDGGPPLMGDDEVNGMFVTIPTVSLRRADGLAILAQIGGGVTASIAVNARIFAGANESNKARVFAPNPVVPTSISHFDTIASRNLLMEPSINSDLTHKLKAPDDLTYELLKDIGWFPHGDGDGVEDDVDCSLNSDLRPTIVIGGIDTGVTNTLFANGCTSSDLIAQLAASARDHGAFVSAVAQLTNQWVQNGLITGQQKAAIQIAAEKLK
jgi:hypothetical protein